MLTWRDNWVILTSIFYKELVKVTISGGLCVLSSLSDESNGGIWVLCISIIQWLCFMY